MARAGMRPVLKLRGIFLVLGGRFGEYNNAMFPDYCGCLAALPCLVIESCRGKALQLQNGAPGQPDAAL